MITELFLDQVLKEVVYGRLRVPQGCNKKSSLSNTQIQ